MNFFGLIFVLIAAGILNAAYLNWQYRALQKTGRKMVCLLGGDCEAVVTSRYGRTFGVKNETIGIMFYGVELFFMMLIWIFPRYVPFQFLVIAIASLASMYSSYLTYVQSVILRKYCSWCLLSTAINILILSLTTYTFLG